MSSAKATTGEQVVALRETIATRQRERQALLKQSRSRTEVVAVVDQLVQHWDAEGCSALATELLRVAEGGPPEFLTVKGIAVVPSAPCAASFAIDLSPILVSVLGAAAVRAAILDAIEQVPTGLPASERRTRVREIDAELDQLEGDEERLIEESEAAGRPIARRADARPEIVLAT
jgi:hypothetical protein